MKSNLFFIILLSSHLSFGQIFFQPGNCQMNMCRDLSFDPDATCVLEMLGAQVEPLSFEEATSLGLYGGVRISQILVEGLFGSHAPKVGFIITHVNREPVNGLYDLKYLLKNTEGPLVLRGFYDNLLGRNAGIGEIFVYELWPRESITPAVQD